MLEELKQFVRDNTIGRDPSHGYEHMEKVYNNAMKIAAIEGNLTRDSMNCIITVAWLHDVADRKYDKDGELRKRVSEFLVVFMPHCAVELLQCIDAISFSTEKRNGKEYYNSYLLPKYLKIRNIVSDADKLEALGVVGIERCLQYIRHLSKEKGEELSKKEEMENVLEHCDEKLFILSNEYMRTESGKEMAYNLETEMKIWLLQNQKN